jgi:hypothetical protein
VGGGVKAPMDEILKACWLVFSGEMVALALIAMLASSMERGARFVLICAATMILNDALLFHYVGLSFPVYVTSVVAGLFLLGGLLQSKQGL